MPNQEGTDETQNLDNEEPKVKLDEIDPESATPEEVEAVIKTAKTALAQKGHWQDKYKRDALDSSGKTYKDLISEKERDGSSDNQPTKPPPPTETPEVENRLKNLENVEEKRRFGFENEFSPEETDQIFAYAQGMGMKPAEAKDSSFMKAAITATRAESRTSNATPGSSSRSPVIDSKTYAEMKPEERKKNFERVVSGLPQK